MKAKAKKIKKGFALPTILTASIVLIMVLVTAVSATVAVRTSLRDQHYTQMAELAAEAGNAYASSCMESNNDTVTWTNDNPLRPNTDCSGNIVGGMPAYNYEEDGLRTYFVVPVPSGGNVAAKGYTEAVRTSTGIAWRVWGADVAKAASGGGSSLPIGTFLDGAWTTAPEGFLLANGAAVSRTTYADLFAVIGTTYGAGNGSTTFNLPDARGTNSIALDSGDASFNSLTDTGGEKTHVLTIPEMPSHTHTQNAHSHSISDPGHSHAQVVTANSGGSAIRRDYSSDGNGGTYAQGVNTGGATTGISIQSTTAVNQNTGGGAAHNVLDPYMVVTRVIKY